MTIGNQNTNWSFAIWYGTKPIKNAVGIGH